MEIFNLTLVQMLMMFSLILMGFLLQKKGILPEKSDTAMARLETYIFVPALSLFNMMNNCTVQAFKENWTLLLYGFLITLAAILVSYPLSKIFVRRGKLSPAEEYQRNIYKYAMTFGNFGFMGNFIVLGIWGDEFFYKYLMFTLFMSILCNSWGLYVLIPKEQNSSFGKNLKKGLLSPPIIGVLTGMILGLLGVREYIPSFLMRALEEASKCQGPVAMVLAGVVIGGYRIKNLITNKKVYLASFLRLIVIPAVLMIILKVAGMNKELMTLALIAVATPLGLNTIVYPATYGGDTETGASMATLSHTFSVITIPLMYLVFVVLL